MFKRPASPIFIALGFALLTLPMEGAAQKKQHKQKAALKNAVVHVLDSKGAPLGGVEVILNIERPDGTSDRRLGLTGEDGDVHFADVRSDCVHVQATVRTERAEVEGKPRPCGAEIEAFVVVPEEPSKDAEPVVSPVVGTPADSALQESAPTEAVEFPALEAVPEDPYGDLPAAAESLPASDDEIPVEREPFELRGRIGPDLCVKLFYEPGEGQRTCDDTSAVGLGAELDAAFHFEEWFLVGITLGYRYFGSKVGTSSLTPAELQAGTGTPVPTSTKKESASNHLLLAGFELRLSWMLSKWVLAADVVPVGISHQVIIVDKGQESVNEFFVTLTLSAAYRVGQKSWLGVYTEILQLMPWVDSKNFRPATLSAGVLFGTRLGIDKSKHEDETERRSAVSDRKQESAVMRRRMDDL